MLIPTDSISGSSGLAVRNCVEPRVSWGWSRYFNKYFTPQVTNVPIIPAYVLKLTISWADRVSCGHTKHWTVHGRNILDIFVLFKNILHRKYIHSLAEITCKTSSHWTDWLWLSWGGGVPGPGHVGDEYIKTKPTLKTAWSWTCLLLVWTWQIGSVVAGSQSEHRLGVWWKLMTGPSSHVWSKPNEKELSKFYGHPCLCLHSTST